MKRINSILLINEAYSDNIGDHAIKDGIVTVLEDLGHEVTFSGFSAGLCKNVLEEISPREPIQISAKKVMKVKLSSFFNKFIVLRSLYWFVINFYRVFFGALNCKGVAIIGGGQLVMGKSNFSIAMFSWVLFLKVFGNKVYILSVGIGESFNFFEKTLFKIAFTFCDAIYVREEKGIALLDSLFSIKSIHSPDAAYALFHENNVHTKEKVCCILITDFNVHQRYESEMTSEKICLNEYYNRWNLLANDYAALGYEIIYSWTTLSDKMETLKYQKYYDIENESRNVNATSVEDLLYLFSKVEIVLSGRMHALILGHVSGCKLHPWVLSKKIKMFVDEYLSKSPRVLKCNLRAIVSKFTICYVREDS